MTKEDLENEIKQKAPLTKGMTELVIVTDGGLSAPVINTAVIMPTLNSDLKYSLYLVFHMTNFGPFIPLDHLLEIKDKLSNKKTDELSNFLEQHQYKVIALDKSVLKDLQNDTLSAVAISSHIKAIYTGLSKSIHYCNLSARMHIYKTEVPAGLGRFTRIPVVLINQSPHDPQGGKYLLSNFIPTTNKVVVTTASDPTNYRVVDASEVSFADSLDTTKSSTEEMYVQKMSSIEELEKSVGSCKNTIQANSQVITSLQNKIEEMKVEAAEKENAKKPKRASSKKKTK